MTQNALNLLADYSLEIIPAFLISIVITAILTELIPKTAFEKFSSSSNFLVVFFFSIIGALVPLCTCGMIPLASSLQKKGVPWLIIISFLTTGNAMSVTTLLITLILGFKIMLLRFLFSVIFGILVAYIFVIFFKQINNPEPIKSTISVKACCSKPLYKKIISEFLSLGFSFGPWILISIIFAALITLFLKPSYIIDFAGKENIFSPFLLAFCSFPFYFCGGADVPISKVLLEKGAALGSVLAFMTSSPGINLTSFFVYQKWLGLKGAMIYLAVSFLICGTIGLLFNLVL